MPSRPAAAAGLLAGAALGSCSLGGEEPPPRPIAGAPRDVARVVSELGEASRRGQYRRICSELFTEAARRRAGGRDCAKQ